MNPFDDDAAVMTRLLSGETAAFEEIISRHRAAVYGYLRARVVHTSDAERLTEDVFLSFHRTGNKIDGEAIRPWLLDTARETLRRHVHENRKGRNVAWSSLCLDLEEHETPPADDVAFARLPASLDALDPSAREAIALKYRSGRSPSQIAERLRRSEPAAKELLFRARQILRIQLELDDRPHGSTLDEIH